MSTGARKYLRTDLEVKQGDEPLVDFVEIAEELSPIVCANRNSWLVRRFAAWLPTEQTTNGANEVAIASPACFAGMSLAFFCAPQHCLGIFYEK